jgi:hypothetical protein
MHMANATDPSIPSALVPVVNGVLSLHDFRPQATHTTPAARPAARPSPQITFGNENFVSPADLAVIYNVNPLYTQGITGLGESVAVVARSNIFLSDVRSFRQSFALPANDPQVILNGADPGTANSGDFVEATLDAEYAGALARNSTVKLVASASTATSDGAFLSAQYIVNQNLAPVLSMSFSLCEAQMGASGNAYMNALWQQASVQGITVLVASGDSGAAGCDASSSTTAVNGLAVNAICSTPNSLCVGGTEFNDTANPSLYWSAYNANGTQASALGYIPEVVWNESGNQNGNPGLWAGGGGHSSLYPKPAWQSGAGVPADGKRDVPDLSLTAAAHDGYIVVLGGVESVVGGTSAATPTLAGVFALVAQSTGVRQGAANSTLYALAGQQSSGGPAVFHDVATGNNSVPGITGFTATTAYDLASGLGSVDVHALVTHWSSASIATQPKPALQLTLSASALSLAPSASTQITAKVAGSGGFSAAVKLATTALPKGISVAINTASIASPGSGSALLQLTVAPTVAAGSYGFSVVASSGSLSSSSAVTLVVVTPVPVAPTLTLSESAASVTLLPGARGSITFTTLGNAALNSSIALKLSGVPAGVTASFSPSTISAPGSGSSVLTLNSATTAPTNASSTAASGGSYTVTVTATASAGAASGGAISKTAQFTLKLPSLTASTNLTSLSLARGTAVVLELTTSIAGGFNSPVAINLSGVNSGLPSGVTAKLSTASLAAPGAGTVSITFTAAAAATLGSAKLTITAIGGGLAATVPISLSVSAQKVAATHAIPSPSR